MTIEDSARRLKFCVLLLSKEQKKFTKKERETIRNPTSLSIVKIKFQDKIFNGIDYKKWKTGRKIKFI